MTNARFGQDRATQHAGDLLSAPVILQRPDCCLRSSLGLGFRDEVMPISESSDLRKMCNTQHLLSFRQCLELLADCFRRSSADAHIDLIEDQAPLKLALSLATTNLILHRYLQGKHHARHLAA